VLVVKLVFGGTGALVSALLLVALLAGWIWLATLFVRAGPVGSWPSYFYSAAFQPLDMRSSRCTPAPLARPSGLPSALRCSSSRSPWVSTAIWTSARGATTRRISKHVRSPNQADAAPGSDPGRAVPRQAAALGDATAMPAQYVRQVEVKRPTRAADEPDRRRRLKERLRAEYIAGAEAEWRRRTGRPMTREEVKRVLRRYPETLASTGGVPTVRRCT
jgi:hypothetical protein